MRHSAVVPVGSDGIRERDRGLVPLPDIHVPIAKTAVCAHACSLPARRHTLFLWLAGVASRRARRSPKPAFSSGGD